MLSIVLVAALMAPIAVHEWYPAICCSDNDCAPIPIVDLPTEMRGGFVLTDGRFVPYKQLQPSPDGKWHLCEMKSELPAAERKILCVFAPIGGV